MDILIELIQELYIFFTILILYIFYAISDLDQNFANLVKYSDSIESKL